MSNKLQKTTQPKIREYVQMPAVQTMLEQTLGDPKRVQGFVTSVITNVTNNPALRKCEPDSILSAALLGETLNLPPSPQLSYFYMVPFKDNKASKERGYDVHNAQFQLGYRGYIQLAMRTGQYKKLVVSEVKDGELLEINPFTETIELSALPARERVGAKTIGYYAMFELLNGFTKQLYWSKEEMEAHAEEYSASYKYDRNNSSFWSKDFDAMAKKTMLRQLISKWGIMSTELKIAFESDMGVIKGDGTVEYVDNPYEQGFGADIYVEEQEPEVEKIDFESL